MYNVQPDIEFKKQLAEISGSSLGQCIQCGNCSVVCSLAPEERPFPRKEMIWAGWGLKDKLIGNPDVWLCYQCGDCSTYCPRDIKPGDVIAAIRKVTIREYARPKFLGKLMSEPVWLPLALAIPTAIIALILSLAGTFRIPEGPVDYSRFFPHLWLNSTFTLIILLFYGVALVGLRSFWKDMKRIIPGGKQELTLFKSSMVVLKEILGHTRFSGCESRKPRNLAHLLVFYGFILLIIVTLFAIIATFIDLYPLSITNPFKILGNVASLMLYAGLIIMVVKRFTKKNKTGKSSYEDWLLLLSVLFLTASGTLVEMGRFLNWGIAYHIYFFHLVCVWFVIMYLPFTKLGHILYRTLAMVYARSINRN